MLYQKIFIPLFIFVLVGWVNFPVAHALQMADLVPVGSNVAVEQHVRSIFSAVPVMVAIAECESGFRQFGPDGQVLRGPGGGVLGIYQLSETAHTAKALSMGWDIKTVDGNILYAKYLYEQQGITPWMAAFTCFNAKLAAAPTVPAPTNTTALLNSDLSFGMEHAEVKVLQQLLNKAGFTVAASGLGSPGNEITNFGNLTRAAVRKFQCARMQVCNGDEYATGYGLANAATRQALLAAVPQDTTTPAPSLPPVVLPGAPLRITQDLEIGMKGEQVRLLQKFLQQQAVFALEPTGTFGAVTRASVIAFQKKQGITPASGYVGPKTRAVIGMLLLP